VTDYIPEDCFIDKRKFSGYSGLFDYLNQMPEEDYLEHVHAIEKFIKSEKIVPFGSEYFADTVLGELDSP
jgi:hypothetical protein